MKPKKHSKTEVKKTKKTHVIVKIHPKMYKANLYNGIHVKKKKKEIKWK